MNRPCRALALAGAALAFAAQVPAAPAPAAAARTVESRGCTTLLARVSAYPGAAPVFLRSYDATGGSGDPAQDALKTAAFTYDNALAVIALLACKRPAEARRIGAALRAAALGDTRLRNAYRAGVVAEKPLPNGWWDAPGAHWAEDPYQAGTATGNVAWTALALLALDAATGDPRWREAAASLARWVAVHAGNNGDDGFSGGVEGFDADARAIGWKSTEHNIDLAGVFAWLDTLEPGKWRKEAQRARAFVAAQWDAASGHFLVGTLPDGRTPNRASSALDVQLWAQLLPDAAPEWRRAVAYVEREHAVAGGFDFNSDRDGLWLEGTAQAALAYRVLGRERAADALFATLAQQFAPGGYVWATREPRVSTGLALGSASKTADFHYFRQPHLAATAWAVLAATGRNPFVAPPRAGAGPPGKNKHP